MAIAYFFFVIPFFFLRTAEGPVADLNVPEDASDPETFRDASLGSGSSPHVAFFFPMNAV